MKRFSIGVLAGYLLTSIFSIPPLPSSFWHFMGGITIMSIVMAVAWWRMNDDLHEGDF